MFLSESDGKIAFLQIPMTGQVSGVKCVNSKFRISKVVSVCVYGKTVISEKQLFRREENHDDDDGATHQRAHCCIRLPHQNSALTTDLSRAAPHSGRWSCDEYTSTSTSTCKALSLYKVLEYGVVVSFRTLLLPDWLAAISLET